MKYLHTMLRVSDLDAALDFFCNKLGLVEVRRKEVEAGEFTLVFLRAPEDLGGDEHAPEIELTYNWGGEELQTARAWGHLAFRVDDIYAVCERLQDKGVTINRPPREGHMAFVKSPDGHSIELLQKGDVLPEKEPWKSMDNTGSW